MKKLKSFGLISALVLGFSIFSGCTTDPVESCEEDTTSLCVPIAVCCNEDDCTYTVNGVEYTSMEEAINNISCQSIIVNGQVQVLENVAMARMQELTEMAKLKLYE